MSAAASTAHRLRLTAAELALLLDLYPLTLPPGFITAVAEPELPSAAAALAERGVVVLPSDAAARAQVVPSIAANLAVLAAPTVGVRVEVSARARGLRALFAVSGPLGASLYALDDGAVELSMFPAAALGRELIRAVPPPTDLRSADGGIGAALSGGAAAPLAGRLPLSALEQFPAVRRLAGDDPPEWAADDLGPTGTEAALAERVSASTHGALWCLVTGRGHGALLVGQVVWLATDAGWVGIRPDPDGSGRRIVTLQPVVREDIGVWLSPHVGQILEAAGERS